VTSEEYARDSYENVLFSICRFFEITGRYPRKMTVIGFGFKAKRFADLHRKAIRFPKDRYILRVLRLTIRFTYIGIDPEDQDLDQLARQEYENAFSHFESDPYACSDSVLTRKRLQRNPFRRMHGYGRTNPAVLELLSWCPVQGNHHPWFDGSPLPWDTGNVE
jgi:hypothetical protein